MTACRNPINPINPINQVLVDIFGENFIPATGQPVDHTKMVNEKLMQWPLPGNVKVKPSGNPQLSTLGDVLSQMTGIMSQVMMFVGPVFIIIDVIKGIINVICALLNPGSIVSAVTDLILNVLPPLLGLFPAFAGILIGIDICKLIIGIVVQILTQIIPLIDLIVANFNSIKDHLLPPNFNIAVIDPIAVKICMLLQQISNGIGLFSPLSLILEAFKVITQAVMTLPCSAGDDCCGTVACPPFIVNPPQGTAIFDSEFDATLPRLALGESISDSLQIVSTTTLSLKTGVVSANEFGLVGSKPIGSDFTTAEFLDATRYVISPSKIPQAEQQKVNAPKSPFTLALKVTNKDTGSVQYGRVKSITSKANFLANIEIEKITAAAGDEFEYELLTDTNTLLSLNLISLGCVGEVAAASAAITTQTNEDDENKGSGNTIFSIFRRVGGDLPDPPIVDLEKLLADLAQNPGINNGAEFQAVLVSYIDEVAAYHDKLLCIGASRLVTEFSIDKSTIVADGKSTATLTMTVKDKSGAALLANLLPNSKASVEFYSTLGDIGPAIFDSATGTYTASFSATDFGQADISAALVIDNSVCMTPGVFDGFAVNDRILRVNCVAKEESFAGRRADRNYVQSGRGKRR
jgi:hypothetical protein